MNAESVRRESGSLLIIVMMILLLFTGIIVGVIYSPTGGTGTSWGQGWIGAVVNDVFQTTRKINHTSALYLAEAGCEHAKQWLSDQADLGSSAIRTTGTISANTILGANSINLGRGSYTTQIIVSLGTFGIPYYTITSTGTLDPDGVSASGDELRRSIVVKAILGSFARYAYFTTSEASNIWFISSDVLLGMIHTNSSFHIAGKPDFWGMASQNGSTFTFYNNGNPISTSNPSNPPLDVPNFRDGYKLGAATIPYPTNTTDMETAAHGAQGLAINGDSEITLSVGGGDVGQIQYTQNEQQQVWHGPVSASDCWRNTRHGIYHSYYYCETYTVPGYYSTEDVTVTHTATAYDGVNNPGGKAIIYVNGDADVHGTLAGQLTILTAGDLIVTDNITYRVDPVDYDGDGLLSDADGDSVNDPPADRTGDGDTTDPGEAGDDTHDTDAGNSGQADTTGYQQPESADTLGLVAKRRVVVTDDGTSSPTNRKIAGSVMALGITANPSSSSDQFHQQDDHGTDRTPKTGTFSVEHYYNTSRLEGALTIVGSLVQKERGSVGTFSGDMYSTPTWLSGYSKNYIYDRRLLYYPPPYFPPAKAIDLIYWQEVPQ
ncbi:MAG: hypothetical protein NTZ78_04495 [Candidatus Aureabacteria bacterium]|nr:hypothetical protein [Candidatus Auribacterota bacterium]